jgi:hypothetical protein
MRHEPTRDQDGFPVSTSDEATPPNIHSLSTAEANGESEDGRCDWPDGGQSMEAAVEEELSSAAGTYRSGCAFSGAVLCLEW